ncbi:MAG TPA: DUF6089 family protein [Bacteroidia bacterium]|nr:DUF6089 family protein [Bacteroidia bacterium]
MLKNTVLYLFCLAFLTGAAQSRQRNFIQREVGFFGGGSYYLGDINPRIHFLASKPAAGIFFRYENNYRYAFRFGFNYGSVSGSDTQSGEDDQMERNLSFKSQIFELSSVAEFNFFDYRIGHDKYRFTMFLFAGLGCFYFNPKADLGNGYEALRNYKTEAQAKKYSRVQVNIPFGLGFKWNIGSKCGLGIEWGPRRTFTDYLDDVSGTYPAVLSDQSNFTDRTINNSARPGSMRGNPSTRDWYFYYGINLSIKLREFHKQCHTSGM